MNNGNHSKTWVLIADASQARIFSLYKALLFQEKKSHNLTLIGEFSHADSRKKGMDLVSDKMGSYGFGKYSEMTPPKVHEAERFAHELILQLEIGRKEGHFRDLVLVAPPAFMGCLHKHMSTEIQKLVSQNIEKDYTHQSQNELVEYLLNHF